MTSLQLDTYDAGQLLTSSQARTARSISGLPFNLAPAPLVGAVAAGISKEGCRLGRASDMSLVSQMASGIAHDFNNRLQSVMHALDLLKLRLNQGHTAECDLLMESAQNSLLGAAHLTRQLLNFARPGIPMRGRIDVNHVIASMETMLRCAGGGRTDLSVLLGAVPMVVHCDRHQLENALLNLVINAKDAMPKGGWIVVETSLVEQETDTAELSHKRYVRVRVSDTGTGMKQEVVERAFEPFFTTKPAGKGTGLGLAMIKTFAEQSQGYVHLQSAEGVGTEISIYLPCDTGENA
jgi:signal transduction histidine kinase